MFEHKKHMFQIKKMFKQFAEPNAENVYMRFPVRDGRQEPKAAARRSAGRATGDYNNKRHPLQGHRFT